LFLFVRFNDLEEKTTLFEWPTTDSGGRTSEWMDGEFDLELVNTLNDIIGAQSVLDRGRQIKPMARNRIFMTRLKLIFI
jgi:hypothetical protein